MDVVRSGTLKPCLLEKGIIRREPATPRGLIEQYENQGCCQLHAVVQDAKAEDDSCILDSDFCRHLMNISALLKDARNCEDQCLDTDGKPPQLTMVGMWFFA